MDTERKTTLGLSTLTWIGVWLGAWALSFAPLGPLRSIVELVSIVAVMVLLWILIRWWLRNRTKTSFPDSYDPGERFRNMHNRHLG